MRYTHTDGGTARRHSRSRQPLFDQPFCFKKEAPARGLYPDRLLEDLAVIGPRATFGKVRLD